MERKSKKITKVAVFGVSFFMITIFWYVFIFNNVSFSQEKWKEIEERITELNGTIDGVDEHIIISDRQDMVNDLIKSKVLIGMTSEEIIDLLGFISDFDKYELYEQKNTLWYWTSMRYDAGNNWLVIEFGQDGKAISVFKESITT